MSLPSMSRASNVAVSFIIPVFNSAGTLGRAIDSLVALTQTYDLPIEAVIVDDCSTDASAKLAEHLSHQYEWVKAVSMERNSGSPSGPRNLGLQHVQGEFVYFLDSDDEILPEGLYSAYQLAMSRACDVVRAPLIVEEDAKQITRNSINTWDSRDSLEAKVSKVIGQQSTTVGGLIRRSILERNQIRWRDDIRLGEDTLFLIEVLSHSTNVEYSPAPDYRYFKVKSVGEKASTQRYEEKELRDHLTVWKKASALLADVNINYLEIRGNVALRAALQAMCKYNRNGFSEALFDEFSRWLNLNKRTIAAFSFEARSQAAVEAALQGDYQAFRKAIRTRLLVAGGDLKFIELSFPYLEEQFDIKVDKWAGEASHDPAKSRVLANWADVIWCEWMLGNAVWYSRAASPDKTLIIRMHKFELTRNYGNQINFDNVDNVIVVSLPYAVELLNVFDVPREKVSLIPNIFLTDQYLQGSSPERVYNLALVGMVPALKGYHRALEVLTKLRQQDDRYTLTVFGKQPEELSWVANDPSERAYFDYCQKFISENQLEDAVTLKGWANLKQELADFGYVLSVSDLESFHVAPGEAFAAGNAAVFLSWDGVEYIYPSRYIFEEKDEMVAEILRGRDIEYFESFRQEGAELVRNRYDVSRFVEPVCDLIY